MAASDLARALRNPGRLCLAPTGAGLGTSYPYGGTALGLVRDVRLRWGIAYEDVVAEEWGERTETHRLGEIPVLAFTLEQWDDDLIRRVFPKVTVSGSPSNLADIARIDGGFGPGIVTALDPILFAPLDPAHKAVYFRRPLPKVVEQEALELALQREAVFPLIFEATRDSTWASIPPWQVDRLEHLKFI